MQERRGADRFVISFPIRVRWKDDNGKPMVEEGLTENVGPSSTLIYLPRHLPTVGSKVELVERLGERTLVYARLSDGQPITAEDDGDSRVKIGDRVPLEIDGASAHVFDAAGTGVHGVDA